MKSTLICFIAFLSLVISFTAHAQKLPNKQEVSLRAPAGVKVDGKDLEWNNHFQAYNRSTDIFYIMCNDDDNLYLVIQADDSGTIRKITQGGITLSIDKPGAVNHKNQISITYPVVAKPLLFSNLTRKRDRQIVSLGDADSIINHNNSILEKNCKWIQVIGIEGLDTLISVYNADGVKAAGLFDNHNKYICEMSVSLKYLGFPADQPVKFSYHITLNGAKSTSTVTVKSYGSNDPAAVDALDRFVAKINDLDAQLSAPTNFGGEYTLAKKP